MRKLDYLRLGRISLKANRKTTIQTVIGISFGLVLLFPLLFLIIGFYGGFDAELNNETSYRTHRIMYSSEVTHQGKVLCLEKYEKDINKLFGIEHKVKMDYCYLYNKDGYPVSFSLNGGERFDAIKPKTVSSTDRFLGIEIIDEKYATKPFFDADYNIFGNPLVAGRVFSKKKSKGEIMVSTKFLKDYGLKVSDVVGSTISVYNSVKTTRSTYSTSKDEVISPAEYKEAVEIPIFLNFKIIGVYNSDLYYRRSPRTYSISFDFSSETETNLSHKDYFWISSASLGENGNPIAPERVIKEKEASNKITYQTWYYYSDTPSNLANSITGQGYAFLPHGLGAFNRSIFYPSYTSQEYVEFYNFQFARQAFNKVKDFYRKSVTGENPDDLSVYSYDLDNASLRLTRYQKFYDNFSYICVLLASFGGIIFVATLLNVINTMHFSVESRKGFLGICRAIGMKKSSVRKLFFSQLLIIFLRSYLSTIVFGGAACIAIKYLFDQQVSDAIFAETQMDITLGWWYIPISLVLIVILTTLLSFFISVILVRKVNKTPVLEILSEENKM